MESNRVFMSQSNKKTPIEHYSDPLETIIDFAWSAGADRFWINNAKDELKKLKTANFSEPVAWATINDHGDLFDLRLQNNPYIDQNTIVPLYRKN